MGRSTTERDGGTAPRLGWRGRSYLATDALRRRGGLLLDAVWSGVWLGLLGRADLHAVDGAWYASLGTYQGDEHNRRGLFDWEADALGAHFPRGGRLLVVGAGGGREVLALDRRGHLVDGYECNAALVAGAARLLEREGCRGTVRHLARDRAPEAAESGGRYDGAVVGWSAYMLIAGRRHRIAFLAGVRALLPTGAPVLLSFLTRSAAERRPRLVQGVASALRRLRFAEPVEVGDDLAPNYVHRFVENERRDELAAAGFALAVYRPQGRGPYDSGYAVGTAVADGRP